MAAETDVLAQRFRVLWITTGKTIDANINWQTIYREPKTTVSNKRTYWNPYLLKGLKIKP
jgi:hypothetical protein